MSQAKSVWTAASVIRQIIREEVNFYLTNKTEKRYCLCGCGKHFVPTNRYNFFYPTKIPGEHRRRYLRLFNVKPVGAKVANRKKAA